MPACRFAPVGYRVRPAVALAYCGDTIRFVNLTHKDVTLNLPVLLKLKASPSPIASTITIARDSGEDVTFPRPILNANQPHPCKHGERWRIHYSAFLENGPPIPGESTPEFIIDEQS